jgi:hypothetical protein
MARETLTARIALDGGEEIKKELEALGKAGARAFQQLKEAAEKVQTPAVRLRASINQLRADFGSLSTAGSNLVKDVVSVGRGFDAIATNARKVATNIGLVTAAAIGAGAAVVAFAKSGADAAVNITNQSRALGLTTDAFQDLQAVAKQANLDQGQFQSLISRFTVELAENTTKAGDAAKKAGAGVRQFGEDIYNTGVRVRSLATGYTDADRAQKAAKEATDATTLSLKNLGVQTTENGEALIAFARQLAAIEDPQKRLLRLTEVFGRQRAVAFEPFFNQLIENLDETGKVAGDAIAPLTQLELEMGVRLDKALGRLGTTLERTRLRLAILFSDPVEEGVVEFEKLIRDNQQRLHDFARAIIGVVQPAVRDLFHAILGQDELVQNPAILKMRDQLLQFAADLRTFVFDKALPAFHAFVQAIQFVSDAWNALLGTNVNAQRVIIFAIVAQLLGVFKLLGSVIGTVVAIFKTFSSGFKFLAKIAPVLISLGKVIFNVVRGVAVLAAGFVSLPVLIVAAIAAAAVAIFVFWDEIKAAAIAAWEAVTAAAAEALAWIKDNFGIDLAAVWDAIRIGAELAWQAAQQLAAEAWQATLSAADAAWEGIKAAAEAAFSFLEMGWTAIVAGATAAWEGIVALFGSGPSGVWEAIKLAAASAWDGVVGIVTAAATRIGEGVRIVARAALEAWSGASSEVALAAQEIVAAISRATEIAGDIAGAQELAAKLIEPFTRAKTTIESIWAEIRGSASQLTGEIVEEFTTLAGNLRSAFSGIAEAIESELDGVADAVERTINRLEAELRRLRSAIAAAERASSSSGGGSEPPGLAFGGIVRGPGTSRSDSIWARLSNGEFVMRRDAVAKYGVGLMRALNSGRISLEALMQAARGVDLSGLSDGVRSVGRVAAPAFATGGLVNVGAAVGGGRPFQLVLPGGEVVAGMTATDDAIAQLSRYAMRRQLLSGGQKPSWYGS